MSEFGEQFEVEKQPTDFCIGRIKGFENLRASKNSEANRVVDVVIEPVIATRKRDGGEKFYVTFREAWLQPGHGPAEVGKEGGERFLYDQFFGKKGSNNKGAIHQLLSNGEFSELKSLVQEGGVSGERFVEFLNERLSGKLKGYSLKQSTEREKYEDPDTGEQKTRSFRTEYKNVGGFFEPEDVESLEKSFERAKKRAQREHEKTGETTRPSMRIAWEPGINPFEAAVEALS